MPYSAEHIARVVHAANREIQAANADPAVPVAVEWDALDEVTRRGVLDGVHGVLDGNTPEESHEQWCAHKRDHGWTYGPVKDETAKTHPCLVDYDDLPAGDRVKDELFVAIVQTLGDVDPGETPVDLDGRHPSVAGVARFLLEVNPNLPPHLHLIAALVRVLAVAILDNVGDSAELTDGLRLLLRAKDSFVRAAL